MIFFLLKMKQCVKVWGGVIVLVYIKIGGIVLITDDLDHEVIRTNH